MGVYLSTICKETVLLVVERHQFLKRHAYGIRTVARESWSLWTEPYVFVEFKHGLAWLNTLYYRSPY